MKYLFPIVCLGLAMFAGACSSGQDSTFTKVFENEETYYVGFEPELGKKAEPRSINSALRF